VEMSAEPWSQNVLRQVADDNRARTSPRSPAVQRTVDVLELLSHGDPLTPSEVADRLGLPKSSAADLCGALLVEDLVHKSGDGTLSLGLRFERLTAALAGGTRVLEYFNVACSNVAALDGHTVVIETLQGRELLCLEVRMGRHPLPLTPRPGRRHPVLESAGGQALLYSLSTTEKQDALSRFASHQGLEAGEMTDLLAERPHRVLTTGSVEHMRDDGVLEIAHPLPESAGAHVLSAVVVHVPPREMNDKVRKGLSNGVRALADALSTQTKNDTDPFDPVQW
jgi:DNA-binding IclR family transcriptional regulator